MKKLAIIAVTCGVLAVSALAQANNSPQNLPVVVNESSYKAVIWNMSQLSLTPHGTYSDNGPNSTDTAQGQAIVTAYANNAWTLALALLGGNVGTQVWSVGPTSASGVATNGLQTTVTVTDSVIALGDGLGPFTNTVVATIN